MLAAWPDVFAAGGIDAGIPYDCPAATNADVFTCMSPGRVLAADDWGSRVKAAYPGYGGPHPRVTIWQGTQDHVVAPANETELVKQWTSVHGIAATPTASDTVASYPHDVFADASGAVLVERYAITGMDHGFAVDPSHGCGTPSQYLPDEHVCTADLMLRFFGVEAAPPAHDAGRGSLQQEGGSGAAPGVAPQTCAGSTSSCAISPPGSSPSPCALFGVVTGLGALARRRRGAAE
jgi:poly(3-hydroxybutyrate) depolymerase